MLQGNTDLEKEFQAILKEIIPSKKEFFTPSGKTAFSKEYNLIVPYNLIVTYDSSVVGTAFDYIARFMIAKKLNKINEVKERMNAQKGLEIVDRFTDKSISNSVRKKYNKNMKKVDSFLSSKNKSPKSIIHSSTFLARLEHINRSGMLPSDIETSLLSDEKYEIIYELSNMVELFEEKILHRLVKTNSEVVFNPHFGIASAMCGGADADIYIDGILYDFKSSKEFGYRWQDIAQLIGYYLLDQISKKHADENNMLYKHKIDAVAFYKARYGEIEYYNVAPLERDLELTIIKIEKLLEPQLDIAKARVAFIDAQNELERSAIKT